MRADDIRNLTVAACEQALQQCMAIRARGGPDVAADVDRLERLSAEMVEFWREASPAFCHAWFGVVSESAG